MLCYIPRSGTLFLPTSGSGAFFTFSSFFCSSAIMSRNKSFVMSSISFSLHPYSSLSAFFCSFHPSNLSCSKHLYLVIYDLFGEPQYHKFEPAVCIFRLINLQCIVVTISYFILSAHVETSLCRIFLYCALNSNNRCKYIFGNIAYISIR